MISLEEVVQTVLNLVAENTQLKQVIKELDDKVKQLTAGPGDGNAK